MAQVQSGGNGWTGMAGRIAHAVALVAALTTAGCNTIDSAVQSVGNAVGGVVPGNSGPPNGTPGFVKGFLGGVAADEPSAALVGREVLSAGGTAADAAVAVGFALAVTLPSRAGLGGGGACLAYDPRRDGPNKGVPQAVLFVPPAPAHPGGADRPAAVPMLARGLFLLHSRYGTRRFESLLGPAEAMARGGVTVSRSLAHDLSIVAGPLAADPGARVVFFPSGAPVTEGQRFVQPGLAATLSQLRRAGAGDLYQGVLAHTLTDAAHDAGGGLTLDDLRGALASLAPALHLAAGADEVTFLPPPADGGLAAMAAFAALRQDPAAVAAAGARALAVAARWRQGGTDAQAVLAAAATLPAASLPPLPASTSFAVLDRHGSAVVCALTMNNLFGTGRVASGTGILLAASPAVVPTPLLTAAIAYAPGRHAFRAAVGASGQEGAPLAAAVAMRGALAAAGPQAQPMPAPVPAPGRANVIACPSGLPGPPQSCGWAVDPRGSGLAIGGERSVAAPPSAPPLPDNYAPAPGVPTYR
ncbi:MAG: gamma-glutamyltransferase [Rhodospirillales bacterium]|nr:gamma-glutamyltransferase [Rhodospirillales bacterium]